MCLILFAYNHVDQYKLVLLANRDEYHQRVTKPADFWSEHPSIFGGTDGVAGGSWLSVDKTGRFAAITNVRKPPYVENTKRSRGKLINEFLSQPLLAEDYIERLKQKDQQYGLFNLLLFDASGLWHYSNDTHHGQHIKSGLYGLSNATLNTPWPKLKRARCLMQQSLAGGELNPTELFDIMQSQELTPDSDLPQTGVGLEFERLLSSIFIKNNEYGTRCSTLVTIDQNNILEFCELSYDSKGHITSEVFQQLKSC